MSHVNKFCVKEITNAHFAATLYHEIMRATPTVMAAQKEIDATKKEEATIKEENTETGDEIKEE